MTEFEQQRRQQLLDEDFYHYYQGSLNRLINRVDLDLKSEEDPYSEFMIHLQYEQFCLDYTIGKPISELLPQMEVIMKYATMTIDYIERCNTKHPKDPEMILFLTKTLETEVLSSILGLCILFERQDWFKTIVKAVGFDKYNSERAIDSLMFRTPLYKAIHAEKPKQTLKFLDEYLRRWYDGLRKAGYAYIDSHLNQQGRSRHYCSFVGYWCFETAAVAYLKGIDDSSLHRFIYYPKDMIEWARGQSNG